MNKDTDKLTFDQNKSILVITKNGSTATATPLVNALEVWISPMPEAS